MLDMILQRKGFNSDLCCDGAEAVDLVKSKGFEFYQLIFMDSLMPVMVCFILFLYPFVSRYFVSLSYIEWT